MDNYTKYMIEMINMTEQIKEEQRFNEGLHRQIFKYPEHRSNYDLLSEYMMRLEKHIKCKPVRISVVPDLDLKDYETVYIDDVQKVGFSAFYRIIFLNGVNDESLDFAVKTAMLKVKDAINKY